MAEEDIAAFEDILGITFPKDYVNHMVKTGPQALYHSENIFRCAIYSLYEIDKTARDLAETYGLSLAKSVDLGVFPIANLANYGEIFVGCSRYCNDHRVMEISSWDEEKFVPNKSWVSFEAFLDWTIEIAQEGSKDTAYIQYPVDTQCKIIESGRGKVRGILQRIAG